MFTYRAYGLGIVSELPLPELEIAEGTPDIHIQLGTIERELNTIRPNGTRLAVSQEEICITYPNVGTFLAQSGSRLTIDPAPDVDGDELRLTILGPALAMLLHQRGLLVLHASAVESQGRAIAFLGGSGWGKSTLAAALYTHGLELLADDLVPIAFGRDGVPRTFPGFPQLKLYPDAARAAQVNPDTLPRLLPHSDKRAHRLHTHFANPAIPIGCLYILDEGDELAIAPLTPAEALIELVRHSFLARLLQDTHTAVPHLEQCTRLIARVPIRRVRRVYELDALDALVERIQADLARI
ncbi:MAG TPA: hypothetical protein VFD70_15075 [Anaerolineae bacterium]|nr:hypothetical protein [Anaerolineae bacterium]